MHVSYSRVSTYLRCPYAHYLGYMEKWQQKRPARPLIFGGDFHKLLEFRGSPEELKLAKKQIKETYYEIPAIWQSDLGENYIEDLFTIFRDYNRVYKDAPLPTVTEERFELLLGKYKGEPIIFVGVIDELYKHKKNGKKKIIIGEHKTFSRPPDMNTLTMNTQKCMYAKAAHLIYDVLPSGVIWDYVKSTPAKSPIWLEKSKRFSLSKSAEITRYSWLRACKERNIEDPELIKSGLELYKDNTRNFFFRVEQDLHPEMIENIWEGFKYTSLDIAKNGHKNKTKNVTKDCSWCNFRDVCFSEMTGGDTKYLLERNYQRKEEKRDVNT